MPTCSRCKCVKPKADFAPSQRKKPLSRRLCRSCSSSKQNEPSQGDEQLSAELSRALRLPSSPTLARDEGNYSSPASSKDNIPLSPGWSRAQDESTITVEPGKKAVIIGLESKEELNGAHVTIQALFDDGQVSVLVPKPIYSPEKTIMMKRENLILRDLCPICMDVEMDTESVVETNSSHYWCCGKRTCHECAQRTPNPNRCPICRADRTHDCNRQQVKWAMKRAKQGDPEAMYHIAGQYDFGQNGIVQDQSMARLWYGRAAKNGHRDAAHNLACCHRDGEGGPVNLQEAFRLFKFAAERGNNKSMTNVGDAYLTGRGVAKDICIAEIWYKKAAAAGNPRGMMKLEDIEMIKVGTLDMVPLGGGFFSRVVNFNRP